MALIELNDTEDQAPNPPKPSSSNKTTTESAANDNRTADDGFETASDGELADSDDDDDDERHNHRSHQQQQQVPEQLPEKSEQQEEQIVSDDELKQKALAQANDAKLEGNKLYGNGQFEEALSQYELALYLAPDMPSSVEIRSTCHSNRAICYLKLGKYEDTVKECTKALELNPSYIKALLRRAEAREKLENFEEAIADMKKSLELDPLNDQAKKSIRRLEPLAEQKREKMKEEMIGKLKEMGNSLLGRFGMSVDNFKAVKDPNTGSYSVSFQR
ncbi:tetratricopeptide repeat protein 1 [Morus notabilis]|uniref:tetratricopeptide repeat protein 1 n=1 Tax=Morus notabilis TaxID=981085 RepID=UPI000CECF5A0|nr:tetratricopeptide repeat protein 1 [Morus notabilis]